MASSSEGEPGVALRIADGLDVVLIGDDEVLVQFGSRSYPSQVLRDTDLTGILGKVVGRLLTGPRRPAELLADIDPRHQADAVKLLDDLQGKGILTRTDTSPVDQYLAYTFTGQTRLTAASVSLIGAGPVGARTAETLLQHGVGRLLLLEGRPADQTWHALVRTGADADPAGGVSAPTLLRDRLLRLGYTGMEAFADHVDEEAVERAVHGADLTVLALEQPDIRLAHLVNRHCLAAGKPWLHTVMDGGWGRVGPLVIPGVTACYNDFRTLADAADPNPLMTRVHRAHTIRRGAVSFAPGLPAHAEIVSGFASLAAVHFLLMRTGYLLGRVLTVNFDRMLIDVDDVLKLPRCPVCGRQRSAYQPPFSAEVLTRAPVDGQDAEGG